MNQSYKLLKLNSGEDIVCKTEENLSLKDKETIFIQDPMVLNQLRTPFGAGVVESYTLSPWLALAEDEFYEIPVHYIILAVNIKETLKDNYIKYVQERKEAELNERMTAEDLEVEESDNQIEKEDNNENLRNTISRRRGRLVH
jgi:hypothetical protein